MRSPVTPMVHERVSLLDTRSLDAPEILSVFGVARAFSDAWEGRRPLPAAENKFARQPLIACLFFEPSTRTRMSFQTAALRAGFLITCMDVGPTSSASKGETAVDTVLNAAALQPDAMVIRFGVSDSLSDCLTKLSMPVISGGTGVSSHPTQALLDAYTIAKEFGSVAGQRVLIVGDVAHSRVARSNFDVLRKLGAEVAVCAPEKFQPAENEREGLRLFSELNDEALAWPTVYMGLRIQLERHSSSDPLTESGEYNRRYGLTQARLEKLAPRSIIMHPGPINQGVEFSVEIMNDSRMRVLDQVTNGVAIRAAILRRAVQAKWSEIQ